MLIQLIQYQYTGYIIFIILYDNDKFLADAAYVKKLQQCKCIVKSNEKSMSQVYC